MSNKFIPLIVFISAYLLFIFLPQKRSLVAMLAACFLLIVQSISISEAFYFVNWNVLGIFVGMLIMADLFLESRVPLVLAERIVDKAKNIRVAIIFLCVITGFISAFVENVATVLIIAPVALSLADKIRLNPTKMMIAIAVSSNLQGAATLVGDPPSMLLGGFAKMSFLDFFFYKGKPSIFFAVELGALASLITIFFIFRKEKREVKLIPTEKVVTWIPTILLLLLVLLLALTSFFDPGFKYQAGIICMSIAVIALIFEKLNKRVRLRRTIKSLDWDTTFFLFGIFIIVGSLSSAGWIEWLANIFVHIIKGDLFLGYTLLVLLSVIISAFVDNVPFLAAMLPVATKIACSLNMNPTVLFFGLLIGASLGGNITPIGASANIVICGLLKQKGYHVSFKEFAKIGIPFTLSSVTVAWIFIWFVWRR